MAITYAVTAGRSESGGYTKGGGRKDSLRATWNQNFGIEVTDPADPTFNAAFISTFEMLQAATAAGLLPIVNRTVYFDPGTFTGNPIVVPFLVCRSKNATRNPSNPALWSVDTSWDTGDRATGTSEAGSGQGGEIQPIPPPASVAAYPARVEALTGKVRRQAWVDADGNFVRLPTTNHFAEPFFEIRGSEVRRVTQYETGTTSATLATRRMAVNSDTYQGDAAGTWLIKEIESTGVDVATSGGSAAGFEVEYTVEKSPFPEGWLDHRALLDTHYLATASDVATRRPFYDERLEARVMDFINADGSALGAAPAPVYLDSKKFAEISFAFLKA